jgi:hypothetical protein
MGIQELAYGLTLIGPGSLPFNFRPFGPIFGSIRADAELFLQKASRQAVNQKSLELLGSRLSMRSIEIILPSWLPFLSCELLRSFLLSEMERYHSGQVPW